MVTERRAGIKMMTPQELQQLREDFRDDLAAVEKRLNEWLGKIEKKSEAAAETAAAAKLWREQAPCGEHAASIRVLELGAAAAKGARVPAFLGSLIGALIAGAGLIIAVLALRGNL